MICALARAHDAECPLRARFTDSSVCVTCSGSLKSVQSIQNCRQAEGKSGTKHLKFLPDWSTLNPLTNGEKFLILY